MKQIYIPPKAHNMAACFTIGGLVASFVGIGLFKWYGKEPPNEFYALFAACLPAAIALFLQPEQRKSPREEVKEPPFNE